MKKTFFTNLYNFATKFFNFVKTNYEYILTIVGTIFLVVLLFIGATITNGILSVLFTIALLFAIFVIPTIAMYLSITKSNYKYIKDRINLFDERLDNHFKYIQLNNDYIKDTNEFLDKLATHITKCYELSRDEITLLQKVNSEKYTKILDELTSMKKDTNSKKSKPKSKPNTSTNESTK